MKLISTLCILGALLVGCQPPTDATSTSSAVKDVYETSSTPPVEKGKDESAAGKSAAQINAESGSKSAAEAPKEPASESKPPKDGDEVAVVETKFGKIVLKFRPDKAPNHVKNFIKLAKEGFYDKTIFHRCIPGFMIQGGDPNTKDPNKTETYGQGGPSTNVNAEFNDIKHKRGILSMARSSDPNSAGSQFFICVAEAPSLDGQYSAFGEVVSGMDVADKIVAQPRNSNDLPNERIEMTVKIVKWPVK